MKAIGKDFGDVARKTYAVASGALGNGNTCVVNSDGTVSVATGNDASLGSVGVFSSSNVDSCSATFDSNSNRVVIVYADKSATGSGYGTAVVGTLSGSSISYGTPVVFDSAGEAVSPSITFDSNSNRVVIVYRVAQADTAGWAIVGTVSSTAISFGTRVSFNGAQTLYSGITFDSNSNKVVIAYMDAGNSNYGTAIVGTVSSTAISFGSEAVFESATARYMLRGVAFDSNSNKVVIAYMDDDDGNAGKCVVATVSGTSISFGTAVEFAANVTAAANCVATFDSTSNKMLIAYGDADNSNYGTAKMGSVSGTSISFGSAAVFNASYFGFGDAAYDTSADRTVITYQGPSDKAAYVVATVSGTSVSFSSEAYWLPESDEARENGITFDSNSNKIVFVGRNASDTDGVARVFTVGATNLTSENYIGITPSAYPTGAGAEIQTKGAVNEQQSGLTAGQSYYVQTDGTLGLTAATPSIFAGTAVSATKIIVKG
tara:strand:+ start:53 stop:1516 length:1464 start_codon:yes stop_codon:yes gene_type:complete